MATVAKAARAGGWGCCEPDQPGYCPVEAADKIYRAAMRTLRERDGEWVALAELAQAAGTQRANVSAALATKVAEGKVELKDDAGEDWYSLAGVKAVKKTRPQARPSTGYVEDSIFDGLDEAS